MPQHHGMHGTWSLELMAQSNDTKDISFLNSLHKTTCVQCPSIYERFNLFLLFNSISIF